MRAFATSQTSRGSTYKWQSHQRFLARRCLRNTASQRMPIFSSTRIEALLLTSTVEMMRSARRSKNAASMSASAISVAYPLPQSRRPSMYPRSTTSRSMQRQIACADHAPGGDFLDREFEAAARHFALRGEQAVEIVRPCCPHRADRRTGTASPADRRNRHGSPRSRACTNSRRFSRAVRTGRVSRAHARLTALEAGSCRALCPDSRCPSDRAPRFRAHITASSTGIGTRAQIRPPAGGRCRVRR